MTFLEPDIHFTDKAIRTLLFGFRPDIIVGVCGGWIPARVLSDLLDNPNLANVGAESYLV